MSSDWVRDIAEMHDLYQVREWVAANPEKLNDFLDFRLKFLQEELRETEEAVEAGDAEEIVDGLIDLCFVAIGTLDAFGVDPYQAWDEVFRANMSKRVGVKESRPNALGMPDLVKPEDWVGPSHEGNHGLL